MPASGEVRPRPKPGLVKQRYSLIYGTAADFVNLWFRNLLLAFQFTMLLCFAFMKKKDTYGYREPEYNEDGTALAAGYESTAMQYGSWQDVHVMIYVGFGFLMTFLKSYNWSAVGFTMMISSVVVEWAIVVNACFFDDRHIHLGFLELYEAEFAAGAVLITFGGLLGKTNHLQLLVIALFEVVFYKLNQYFIADRLPVWVGDGKELWDIGGSMVIHAFGAYFGLALAKAINHPKHSNHANERGTYGQDLFAMVGTIFLWMYWPSFNSMPATDDFEKRIAITNTYLSLAASCIVTFAISGLDDKHHRISMVHIQNATLAGGVAMGSSANMLISPFGAILVGTVAGLLSTGGYQLLQERVLDNLKIHDTCGVHNLHGMPGILGCLFSIAFGLIIDEDSSTMLRHGYDFTTFSAPLQIYALLITLFWAIVGGYATGLLVDLIPGAKEDSALVFDDAEHWRTYDETQ